MNNWYLLMRTLCSQRNVSDTINNKQIYDNAYTPLRNKIVRFVKILQFLLELTHYRVKVRFEYFNNRSSIFHSGICQRVRRILHLVDK